jgi:hypothetical protein
VTTRGEQRDERKGWRFRGCVRSSEKHGKQVPDEMIDADDREPRRPREALRSLDADEKRPHESGAIRHGNPVEVCERQAGTIERLVKHGRQVLQVVARRELGNDATVRGVKVDLAMDHVGEDTAAIIDDRDSGFVARRLDP